MPGRTYSATGTEPSSLIIPWGGINGYSGGELLTNCADNFTIELWVKTGGETHEIDQLYATGGGTSGQRYVIDPPQGLYYNNSYDDAGVGISVGTNGVSIYEHNYGYMPAVLIWEGTVVDWTHIALVYENKIPRLYINGNLVGTGTASPKTHVYPGTLLGSGVFGTMNGWIDEARIWSTVRTQQQIQENMNKSVATPQSNLEAYWPIQTGETTNLQDISGNNHTVVLPPGNNYGSYTNDGSSTAPLSGDYYYRYGFNGKENDNEVKGTGNQQDYGMRIYDPRLGKFLSVDPITKEYPELTPYQFASNTPIQAIDLDGLEAWVPAGSKDARPVLFGPISPQRAAALCLDMDLTAFARIPKPKPANMPPPTPMPAKAKSYQLFKMSTNAKTMDTENPEYKAAAEMSRARQKEASKNDEGLDFVTFDFNVNFGYAGVRADAGGFQVGLGAGVQERVLLGISDNKGLLNGSDGTTKSVKKFSFDLKAGIIGGEFSAEENAPIGLGHAPITANTGILVGPLNFKGTYRGSFNRNLNSTPVQISLIGGKVGIGLIGVEGGIKLNFGIGGAPVISPPPTGIMPSESTSLPPIDVKLPNTNN